MRPNPDFWSGRPVCVTGGTGFLGHHLVRQLLDLRADVCVLALEPAGEHPIHSEPVRSVYGDVRDIEVVRRAAAGCRVLFHTAGVVAMGQAADRMQAVHVEGTRNVLAAAPAEARIVHTSSLVAVGAARDGSPVTEQSNFDPCLERLAYVRAKRAAEELALAAARERDVVVTNPTYMVGPDDHEASVMGRFCVRYWKGGIAFAPPGGFNLVDVRDVAGGHLLAAEHGRPGRRYILGGADQLFPAFLAMLARAAGYRPRATPRLSRWPFALLAGLSACRSRLTGRQGFLTLDHARLSRVCWFARSDRAASELGYSARPLLGSLTDAHRWYQAQGKLGLRGFARWWMRPQESAA
ncbi:MAG: NAD-dependent epimerase/dehydratase family protein [Planctomycetes bacterium]|nr:NAD-dependent epimerase/dehydratase family protein [Planctomycetota bacterium]